MGTADAQDEQERYHHGDLRRALLDAALALLNEGAEPGLRAVARRAGVSHTAPYHHFPDRRALVAAVAEEGLAAFQEALREGIARAPAEDAEASLFESGVAYVRFALGNPALFRLMFGAELADTDDLPSLREAYDAAFGVLLERVRTVLGPGAPEEAVQAVALGAWSTVHGLSMLMLDNQVRGAGSTPEEAEALVRRVLGARGPGQR